MSTRSLIQVLGVTLISYAAVACGSSPGSIFGSNGGSSSAQGGAANGGASTGQGGAASTGGNATVQGGTTSSASGGMTTISGGTPSAGGKSASGGATMAGGQSSSGGKSASGGSASGGSGGASASPGCSAGSPPMACDKAGSPCSISVSGTTREYYVVLPQNYSATQPYPVVFAFHYRMGTAQGLLGGNGAFYGVRSRFANAIYVAPQGLATASDPSDFGWPNTGGQDIAFTKALVETLESQYCVDQSRLFSTGMSYGGIMSDAIGCQMNDTFRAIGVMSGALFGNTKCTDHPIAAWFTHGTADDVVAISGDEKARDTFLAANHCGTTTQPVDPSPCVSYDGCTSGYPVVWCPVTDEGHTIPSFAGSAIASFFQKF